MQAQMDREAHVYTQKYIDSAMREDSPRLGGLWDITKQTKGSSPGQSTLKFPGCDKYIPTEQESKFFEDWKAERTLYTSFIPFATAIVVFGVSPRGLGYAWRLLPPIAPMFVSGFAVNNYINDQYIHKFIVQPQMPLACEARYILRRIMPSYSTLVEYDRSFGLKNDEALRTTYSRPDSELAQFHQDALSMAMNEFEAK